MASDIQAQVQNECLHALVCIGQAKVHDFLGDVPGCLACYDAAIKLCEKSVREGNHRFGNVMLAKACLWKAEELTRTGAFRAGLDVYSKAFVLLDRLSKEAVSGGVVDALVEVGLGKGMALALLGEHARAGAVYEYIIDVLKSPTKGRGYLDRKLKLIDAYICRAGSAGTLGDHIEAGDCLDSAKAILDQMVHDEGVQGLQHKYATVYKNKATALRALGDLHGAIELNDKAIAIHEHLVNAKGQRELTHELARTYINTASALRDIGDNEGSVAFLGKAVRLLECVVNEDGKIECLGELAIAKAFRGVGRIELGDVVNGKNETRDAVVCLDAEIRRTGKANLRAVAEWAVAALRRYQ